MKREAEIYDWNGSEWLDVCKGWAFEKKKRRANGEVEQGYLQKWKEKGGGGGGGRDA